MPQIYFKILQAMSGGFVNIPDIGPIIFQIIEQKLVQRCETRMEAQSCKDSLALDICNRYDKPVQF